MIETLPRTLTGSQAHILKTLLYFDVFKYPLTEEELYENSAVTISRPQFHQELEELISSGLINRQGHFLLNNERDSSDVSKRLKGNSGAAEVMPLAMKYAKKVASFPFVEGVCLSGALSKNYFDEKGDFDFFVITRPNRLWICRTFLILRYKLLPKNLKKYWCTNYFISSEGMTIPDVNAFTATELSFLIPAVNYQAYRKLLRENPWNREFYPNKLPASSDSCAEVPKTGMKAFSEMAFSGKFGDFVDKLLLKITLRHWKKKFPTMSEQDFELQFRSQKTVCKRHTRGFQNKVLRLWDEKQKEFEGKYRVSL